jgi:hypothetical protein
MGIAKYFQPMPIYYRLLLCVSVAAALVGTTAAQEAQIQQARQFDALSAKLQPAGAATPPSVAAGTTGGDAESFGVQQFLQEKERVKHFRTFAETSAFFTNNVALASTDRQSDSFLVASFGLDGRRPLPHGFQLEAAAKVAIFRYNEFSELDFTSVDTGIGLSYHSGKLGGFDLFVRYNFNALISRSTQDTFFTNHSISLGAQKVISFSQAHYAFAGLAGELAFSDPEVAERSNITGYTGYHLQATRKLETDLLYTYAYFLFTEGGRRDHNHTIAASVRYRFTDWLSAFASVFTAWNASNREAFEYDAATAGGGLSLNLQF